MGKKVALTKIKPESDKLNLSVESEKELNLKNTLRMYAASIDREISRIKTESAVRLGDSIICESSCCDEIVIALQKIKKLYI